jgi:hypothetical protein
MGLSGNVSCPKGGGSQISDIYIDRTLLSATPQPSAYSCCIGLPDHQWVGNVPIMLQRYGQEPSRDVEFHIYIHDHQHILRA